MKSNKKDLETVLKAKDVSKLYNSLLPDAYYINSFQMAAKIQNPGPEVCNDTWNHICDKVNQTFGTNLTDSNEGDGQIYVWLKKDPAGKGKLYSYGCAHRDGAGRQNWHYFIVVGNFDELNRVANTFLENPKNLSAFAASVFGWENEKFPERMLGPEPDLCTELKEMYIHTPELGKRIVGVK